MSDLAWLDFKHIQAAAFCYLIRVEIYFLNLHKSPVKQNFIKNSILVVLTEAIFKHYVVNKTK